MDNAVDSGANQITVEINGGGIDSIRVVTTVRERYKTCALFIELLFELANIFGSGRLL